MKTLETIYLIHHSHTDIGYTHDQPVLWEMQRRFIDAAIDACERDLGETGDHAFRWTVETVAPLLYWLEHSTDSQIERFLTLERQQRIEVMGMFVNITPLMDTAELIELMQPLARLRREYGLTIRSAMNCDVNGQNWGLVDVLLDAGIEGFSMAINQHAGGAPLNRPDAFWWEAPSGRKLMTFNGWHYHYGNQILSHYSWDPRQGRLPLQGKLDKFRAEWLPYMLNHLTSIGWQLPHIAVQLTHGFGDNGSAEYELNALVKLWNEIRPADAPNIRIATYHQWWDAVKAHQDTLPTYRGDWTDFWNFGAISSARESTMNRASRARLMNADKLMSALAPMQIAPDTDYTGETEVGRNPGITLSTAATIRQQAWRGLYLWDEHTWGADVAIAQPECEDTAAQWNHKSQYAYTARSLSLLLQRDGIAELSLLVPRQDDDALIVFNPLPWSRQFAGPIAQQTVLPRGAGDDPSASRHHQDRHFAMPRWWLTSPVEVPAFGYAVIKRDLLVTPDAENDDVFQSAARTNLPYRESAVIENLFHRITFDRENGGVASWFDKRLGREIVDTEALFTFGSPVYERVADTTHPAPRRLMYDTVMTVQGQRGWKTDWRGERWSVSKLLSHKVYQRPAGVEVIQTMQLDGLASPAILHVFIPNDKPEVEFSYEWVLGLNAHPDATYVAMPFAMSDAEVRLDLGGQAMQPEADQIPGCCRDYFTVQNWVDFSSSVWGATIACPENPLVQFGDFHFGHDQRQFVLDQALFLGWVSNNYWETNFRAYQPGKVTARYVVLPHDGGFDETQSHRLGLEAMTPVIAQSAFEPARPNAALPRLQSLLTLPQPPILVLQMLPGWTQHDAPANSITVRLLNASDSVQTATLGSGLLKIVSAEACDLFGSPTDALQVTNGAVQVELAPRRTGIYRLTVNR